MERYLEGEEIGGEELAAALKNAVSRDELFPVACGVATKNLGTHGAARPDRRGRPVAREEAAQGRGARRTARPRSSSRRSPTRSPAASRSSACSRARSEATRRSSTRARTARSASGSSSSSRGRITTRRTAFAAGDIGAVAKLKETTDRPTCSSPRTSPSSRPRSTSRSPVMSFAITPKAKGDEDKVVTALRRLVEEDPTLDLHRDDQTGEQLLGGPLADARRGRRRADQAPLRRRGRAAPAARPVPRDDPQGVARAGRATRSRPAAAASSATA